MRESGKTDWELGLDRLQLRGRNDALRCEVLELVLDGVERAGDARLIVAHVEGLDGIYRVGRCAGGIGRQALVILGDGVLSGSGSGGAEGLFVCYVIDGKVR